MPRSDLDLYAILGVLPSAEHVVIVAAFRALAQRYHPDKWEGDPETAHAKMVEINAAYAVLSDEHRRSRYDQEQTEKRQGDFGAAEENEEAFSSALSEIEERWAIAADVFPELIELRQHLQKFSSALSFEYISLLLAMKQFERAKEIAQLLEHEFLVRYFTSDPVLVEYARKLILVEQRDAALALNRLVDVVGPTADPTQLVSKIDAKFNLNSIWERSREDVESKRRRGEFIRCFVKSPNFRNAQMLVKDFGYEVGEAGQGLFRPAGVVLTSAVGVSQNFKDHASFFEWVKSNLCKAI
ncbi:MAG: J domain-containing protein [Burkholderiaceae bacterium]|jgi:curved DNA-binding protein CbpA|nr:J domain-containing protein [Burkholderiaceae bacterium]